MAREKRLLLFVLIVALLLSLTPSFAPYSPLQMNSKDRFRMPDMHYLLGTDRYGRDILSRILYGSRTSALIALASVGIAFTAGTTIGTVSGFVGGWIDTIFMRVVDILFAIPLMVLAIVIAGTIAGGVAGGIKGTIFTISIVYSPIFARVARNTTWLIREEPFFEAARALGADPSWIMLKHVVPNLLPICISQVAILLPNAIVVEAALSFLGLGVNPPYPSLGSMLQEGRIYIDIFPWATVAPAAALVIVVLVFNILSELLEQRFSSKRR